MTRNTPYEGSYNQGQAQSYYNQSNYGEQPQQQQQQQQQQFNTQYGGGQGQGQGQGQGYDQSGPGYNQSGQNYSQPGYSGEDRPGQQSNYGPSGQQYQQHQQNQQPSYGNSQQSYGAPSPYQQPASPPQHAGAPYGQQTNASANDRDYYTDYHTSGSDVDNFKSHFDQPNAPPHGQNDNNYSGQSTYGQSGYGQPGYGADAQQGDRGILGAMGGGVAGGFAGHKMGHHGIIGTVGGALAGSIAEDQWKKHQQHEKDQHHQQQQPQGWAGQQPSHSAPAPAGNFHASSKDVHLERERFLVAECADVGGHHRRSELDLNDCLTNNNGHLGWARGGGFHASARNVRLADGGQTLEAELADVEGRFRHDRIWLNERIGNDNGRLHLV